MSKDHTISRMIWFNIFLPGLLSIVLSLTPMPIEITHTMSVGDPSDQTSATRASDDFILLQFQPWRVEIYEKTAVQALTEGRYEEAIAAFEQAAEKGSISASGIIDYGQAWLQMGDANKALKVWQHHQVDSPTNPTLYERIFAIQLDQGDIPAVLQTLQDWNDSQSTPQAQFLLAQALSLQEPVAALETLAAIDSPPDELASQIESLEKAITSGMESNDQSYYYIRVGQNLASGDAWEFARFAFRQAVAINPGYAEAWALLGQSLQQTGGNGLPDIQKAVALDPSSVTARALYGLSLRENGEYDQALMHFEYLADTQPENPTWQIELGNTSLAKGEIKAAVDHFRAAITLNPDDPRAWKALAWVCTSYGIDIRETALPAARQAILLAPQDVSSQIILGQIMQLEGDDLSAERAYSRGLQMDGANPQAHYYLGVLYLENGNRDQAYHHLSLAAQTGMDLPEKDLANRYIDIYFSN